MKAGWRAILAAILVAGTSWSGTLKVVTHPAGADVYVNDRRCGTTGGDGSLLVPDLPEGRCAVRAEKSGFAAATATAEVTELVSLVSLELAAAAAGARTDLILDGNVAGAMVFVDGQAAGITGRDGRLSLNVQPGRHRLEVRLDGFQGPAPFDVEVGELGQRVPFSMAREAKPGGMPLEIKLLIVLLTGALAAIAAVIVYLFQSSRRGALFHNRYYIRDLIGRGGMATVYRARDKTTGRTVALKIMDPGLAADADLLQKFLREGQAVQGLNRAFPEAPIVRVSDHGRELNRTNGRPFIVMEYLPGKDLLAYLQQRGRLSLAEIREILIQVLKALEAAHSQGIYHRDLTPDNIIVMEERGGPRVRLIDFGVARHEYTSAGTLDASITGKPPYMSPEQCRGQKVDARSDLYSLGIIFYLLLTGAPPFSAANPLEVMRKHESEQIPALGASVPAAVAAVVNRALEKDPARRFAGATDFRRAVEALD